MMSAWLFSSLLYHPRGGPVLLPTRGSRNRFDSWLLLARHRAGNKGQGTTHQHDAGDNVERRLVIDRGDQQRADDAARAPGREHHSVNRASVLRSKEVRGKGRHSAEAAAVAKADERSQDEENSKTASTDRGNNQEGDNLDDKEAEERVGTANKVRNPAPEKATGSIEDGDSHDKRGGHTCRDKSELLCQRGGNRDKRRARRNVQSQDQPEDIPPGRGDGLFQSVFAHAANIQGPGPGCPAGRCIAIRGAAEELRGAYYDDQVGDAQDDKGIVQAERF